ncbi:MAG: PGF-pre-PGF domain-containing protein [Methanomethylovorans sp.]|uniref:PGF-pre-PGF domain-containing protein n=1 Tax=Methanomethylovorans sp. TaxID=2758717 RepID=UPI003530C0E3
MQIKLSKLVCIAFILFSFLITTGVSSALTITTGDQTVTENDLLSFTVATDNINATITVDEATIPYGAHFASNTFSWTPAAGAAAESPYEVTFYAEANGETINKPIKINIIGLDKTALENAIATANTKISTAVVGVEVGQYPQTAYDTFQTAINAAQAVADSTTATQTQINQAVTTLQAAQTTFDAARITSVDKTALTAAITAANTKVAAAVAGTGIGQYPQTAIDTFKAAIATAQVVADSTTATQTQISQALTTLQAAETTFDAAKVTGAASVTNLRESATGTNWITWTWTNPTTDFSHVMIYIDGTFITTTTSQLYNATGFAEGTVHTIGTQTVDTNGNVNPTVVSDQATTKIRDVTAPGTVTNLHETNAGASWIYWTWTKPADADFSNVRIYIDGAFVTTTTNNYYNATGLTNGAEHTIGIETVDTSGNINTAQVSDAATTLKLPVISNVAGTNIKANSITLKWDASEDTTSVQISQNGALLATVNGSTYVHSNLNKSTTYNYTLVPYNQNGLKGEAVSISLTTSSSSSSGGSSGGSSSSKSSSGGGGGGATSVEDLANVAVKDVNNQYLRINTNVTYEFARPGNDILSVSFYSLKNSGEITSTIEVLNNRSKLVNTNPEGLICKYINIWVGKAGFATSNNIKDARVKFKVNNSWMQEMGITTDDIKLQRYNGTAWEVLPTTLENNTTSYSIFEARTPGFSPFAITAVKALAAVNNDIDNSTTNTNVEDIGLEGTENGKSRIWTYIMAFLLIAIIAIGYEYMKKQNN